jgi:tRNA-uridine 2-sulfurtransferase
MSNLDKKVYVATRRKLSHLGGQVSGNKKRVFVAMSGGVDSSVAALLLKNKGYDVTGVHMICWDGCENSDDRIDAMRVAAHLGIPFLVWDFRREYRKSVFDYMVGEYKVGRTPNPDVMCNKTIKFGIFLKKALKHGADFVATGHYVRKLENKNSKLLQAIDQNKDQSYFLWTLTQDQIRYSLFPIGDYIKKDIRKIADEAGLPTATKKDSQGLCFVGKVDFKEFLKTVISGRNGEVVTTDGKKIGMHDGAYYYTVGQRHGLDLGNKNYELGIKNTTETLPHYIVDRNISTNTVIVAEGQKHPSLYKKQVGIENVNFISPDHIKSGSFEVLVRIRYRQPLQGASLTFEDTSCNIVFDNSQYAVAEGQSVVFYNKDEMLGGGIITMT